MGRILVVDDNEANMYLIRFVLKKSGYEVLEATRGGEGVLKAVEEKPALVIMDIQLPDIDGLEAVRRIRETWTREEMPIIAFTSHAMVGDKEKALDAGCSGYIEKPLDPETFVRDIEKHLLKENPVPDREDDA